MSKMYGKADNIRNTESISINDLRQNLMTKYLEKFKKNKISFKNLEKIDYLIKKEKNGNLIFRMKKMVD